MKTVYALAAALAFVVLDSGAAYGQCTTETEQGRRVVTEFATQFGSGSRPAGVPVVDASQIRLLTNASDAAVCQQLFYKYMGQRHDPESAPTDRHWTFYQVGSLYYVVVTRVSPPVQHTSEGIRLRLGWVPILIFNSNFDHLTTVGR
ncbi:MAG TPA: hypothetical protein VFR37_04995 [Longimicrobium sp.]|nr:hypothetical protein [Longimicrobium sp.]